MPVPAEPDGYEILDSREAGGAAIRGGVLRTAAFAGGLLLALISAPLVVRHLGDVGFGRYASVLAIIAIVTGLTEGGINTVAVRELAGARDRDHRDEIMRDLLGLRLVLSAAGVVIAVAFSAAAGYGGDLVAGTLLAGVGMLLSATQTLLAAVLQARLRFGAAAAIEFGRGLLTTVLIVVLVVSDAGVLAFLAIIIPAAVAGLLATVVMVRDATVLRPAFHYSRWLPLLRETSVFALAVAVNSLYFRITLVIMSLVTTAAQTGYFAISFRVIEVLVGIPVILVGAAFPIISRAAANDPGRLRSATARLFELGLLAGLLISLTLTLAAPFAIEVLTGSSQHPATDVLRIQAVALTASFVASATGYPLLSLRRHRETLLANVSSLVVVVALTLVLAPGLGAQGAALSAVVADAVLCIMTGVLLVRHGGPRLPLGIVPVASVAVAAAYAAASLSGMHPLLQSISGGLLFLVLLRLAGRFPPEVAELLRSWRPSKLRTG
jgi:O-antigen/teichoic acid export membrane protein